MQDSDAGQAMSWVTWPGTDCKKYMFLMMPCNGSCVTITVEKQKGLDEYTYAGNSSCQSLYNHKIITFMSVENKNIVIKYRIFITVVLPNDLLSFYSNSNAFFNNFIVLQFKLYTFQNSS